MLVNAMRVLYSYWQKLIGGKYLVFKVFALLYYNWFYIFNFFDRYFFFIVNIFLMMLNKIPCYSVFYQEILQIEYITCQFVK